MSKYINVEKLIAEIERQQRKLIILFSTGQVDIRRDCALQYGVYNSILELINSLQQKHPQVADASKMEEVEVNINKEIDELWESLNTGHDYVIVHSYQDFLGICLHCFELGLNARKL